MRIGEKFGLTLEIVNSKIATLMDGSFKKTIQLGESFTSVRRVNITEEFYTLTAMDLNDPLLSTSNRLVTITTGIQKQVFSQNLELGIRKIEVIQGMEIGQAVIRLSYNIERAMKWQLQLPFAREGDTENMITLPEDIEITIQTQVPVKYEDDLLIFSISEGFSQINLFINSKIPYKRIGKNLLILTKGDDTKQNIISMGSDEKFYPIVTFVYLQDFKNKMTRYEDLHQIGSILALRKQYAEAINYLKKALVAVRALGDQIKEAEILKTLATAENDSGDYQKAASDFNYALKIFEEHQNEPLKIGCLISLSKTLKKLNRFQEALDYESTILQHCRTTQDKLAEAEILVDISEALVGLGRVDEAIDYQKAAIDLRHQMNDPVGEANNLVVFGELLTRIGRVGEAMGCYEQALRIKQNLKDDLGVAECLRSMGLSFFKVGKYQKAQEYYEKAKEAFQNQALVLEVEKIDAMITKMKAHPYEECQICSIFNKCSPDIIGIAIADNSNPTFVTNFKQILRDALAKKNMDALVDLVQQTAVENPDIKSKGIADDIYAFCVLMQAINIHLGKLSGDQKRQILKMVQDTLRKRKYAAL